MRQRSAYEIRFPLEWRVFWYLCNGVSARAGGTDWDFVHRMKHLNFLDGLRAISIFMVMGFHSMGPISGAIGNGWLGVDVFFVISGFLITSLLLREKAQSGTVNLRNFYVRRFLRLMPAYWAFLIVALLVNPHHRANMVPAFITSACYMSDYDLAFNWGNILGSGIETTWSLSVEEKFYLLWPAIVLFLGSRSGMAAVTAILACEIFKGWLCYTHAPCLRLMAAFDTHVDEIMFGCLAAQLMSTAKVRALLRTGRGGNACAFALAAVMVWICYASPHPKYLTDPAQMTVFFSVVMPVFSAAAALLIMLCAANEKLWLARVLSIRPLVWMGVLSYSLYLWHPLVMSNISWWAHSHTRNPVKNELITFAGCLAVAALSYYLIEKPFLKLKKRFEFRSATDDTEYGAGRPSKEAKLSAPVPTACV